MGPEGLSLTYRNGALTLVCGKAGPCRLKLRWNFQGGEGKTVKLLFAETWQRDVEDVGWCVPDAPKVLPWFFLTYDGERTHGCGVETCPNCFAFWQFDPMGVTLWLDVRSGGAGLYAEEPLELCRLHEYTSPLGLTPFAAAREFAGILCPRPLLPTRPIFGSNNWYYAYGDITRASVKKDAEIIAELVKGDLRPYCVIDDGWQLTHRAGYNGGEWLPNEDFGDMAATASDIRVAGAIPGIWFRPLLVEDEEKYPEFMRLRRPSVPFDPKNGFLLDPSVPEVLDYVRETAARIRSWGYELIKHDFTSMDVTGMLDYTALKQLTQEGWQLHDRTMTTAMALKALYRAVKEGAGDALVMGCNTFLHLTAETAEIMRTGGDTSGKVWEITRKDGAHVLGQRQYLHGKFFCGDADCAAFTEMVPTELNLAFLDAVARSGSACFASITPGFLTKEEEARLSEIFEIAARPDNDSEPLDWLTTSTPCRYLCQGEEHEYDWYTSQGGVRTYYTWNG